MQVTSDRTRFVPPTPTKEYDPMPPQPILTANESDRRLLQTKTYFEKPVDVIPPPLRDENQAFVLLNITHRNHRPRSAYPGFRVLGAFPDIHTARSHIDTNLKGSDCSMFVVPTHQLMAICNDTERQQDADYNNKHIETIVRLHCEEAIQRNDDFNTNVNQQETGSVGKSVYAKTKHVIDRDGEGSGEVAQELRELKKTSPFSNAGCLPKQQYAVIIVLSDLRQEAMAGSFDKEPVLAVLGVFSTEADATEYAKYAASRQYPNCAIDIVDMYSWCFPENINVDKIKEVYGNEQLNDIMQGRKDNLNMTEEFEAWCSEHKYTPPTTHV